VVSATPARILLCADEPSLVDDLRLLLEKAGHCVQGQPLSQPEPEDLATYHLVLVDGSRARSEALQLCRRLRGRLAETFLPIIFTTREQAPENRLTALESGADAFLLQPFTAAELLAQVQALLRLKAVHDRLADKSAEIVRVNKRLQQAYQQIDHELELARRIQQSFLPQSLPEVPRASFAVHYQPCGRVGGDFYDVFRLDENHIGLYVADAMGHGVPASLLTIFLKKGIRAKEIFGQQYRLVPPSEVLQRLNRDLIDQELSENPFITMIYGLFNWREGKLQFARAGHPHPLHLPANGDPEVWQVNGSLLGVFETEFAIQTRQLQPGDKVLFYTDGTDTASFDDHPPGFASLQACALRHRALPIHDLVERLSWDLFRQAKQPDDFTLLGLEMR